MKLKDLSIEELERGLKLLRKDYEEYKAKGLSMNISRGRPSKEQLDIGVEIFSNLGPDDFISEEGLDIRQYGGMYGLIECRRLFAELTGLPAENIIIGGNSSYNLLYDEFARLYCFGTAGNAPWSSLPVRKWLCPVPGYDCHFRITENFGFEMINVPMSEDGPDMDMIEKLAAEDPSVKGIWCVPQYSNPTGCVYSDETVRRLASMPAAAPDFKIFWDNAYVVHHLYRENTVLDIFSEARKCGNEDRIIYFTSTAKISYPGSCVSMIAAGDGLLSEIKEQLKMQIFSYDKVNQMRHVKYLRNAENVREIMKKQASFIIPKMDLIDEILRNGIPFEDLLTWKKPDGGYFISVDTYPGCAKRTLQLTKEAGVIIADAGSTFPYFKDPKDSNIRLAPTLADMEDLEAAMPLFCICCQIAGMEKALEEKKGEA